MFSTEVRKNWDVQIGRVNAQVCDKNFYENKGRIYGKGEEKRNERKKVVFQIGLKGREIQKSQERRKYKRRNKYKTKEEREIVKKYETGEDLEKRKKNKKTER